MELPWGNVCPNPEGGVSAWGCLLWNGNDVSQDDTMFIGVVSKEGVNAHGIKMFCKYLRDPQLSSPKWRIHV